MNSQKINDVMMSFLYERRRTVSGKERLVTSGPGALFLGGLGLAFVVATFWLVGLARDLDGGWQVVGFIAALSAFGWAVHMMDESQYSKGGGWMVLAMYSLMIFAFAIFGS